MLDRACSGAMKVVTWNVNGLRKRAEQVVALLEQKLPDVLCLQELKCAPGQVPDALGPLAMHGYWSFWHGAPGGYSGVSLHVKRAAFETEPVFSHPPFDHETRIVQAELEQLVIASVYVPNGGKDFDAKMKFMKKMVGYVGSLHARGRRLVLCGDLNVALEERDVHPSQRKADVIGQRPDERALLRAVVEQGLVDVGRRLKPDNERLFTWWPYWRQARERNLGWRLNYVLASEPVGSSAKSGRVAREFGSSDHAPVIVEM